MVLSSNVRMLLVFAVRKGAPIDINEHSEFCPILQIYAPNSPFLVEIVKFPPDSDHSTKNVLAGFSQQCKPNKQTLTCCFYSLHIFDITHALLTDRNIKHALTIAHTDTYLVWIIPFFPLAMNYRVLCATPATTNHSRWKRHPSQTKRERKKERKMGREKKKN